MLDGGKMENGSIKDMLETTAASLWFNDRRQ